MDILALCKEHAVANQLHYLCDWSFTCNFITKNSTHFGLFFLNLEYSFLPLLPERSERENHKNHS